MGRVILIAALGLALAINATAAAQFTANSLADLRAYSNIDNATVTMAPGVYWIDGDRPDAAYLNFTGTNTTFDLSQAELKIDTRDIAGYRDPITNANTDFDIVRISGSNLVIEGLDLSGHDLDLDTDPDARRFPNRGATYVKVSGSDNTLVDANISTRGSSPYGLGEAFGKGGRVFPQGEPSGQVEGAEEGVVGLPWFGHNKVSGIHVWEASNATIDNLNLSMQTYGHGLFIQKASDTLIRDSAITGELFPASNVEQHPLYIDYGNITSQGVSIPAGIEYSGHEDGIRAYGSIDGVPVTNITVENTVVTNMRNAYSTALARGDINLTNVEAYGSELGFAVNGDTTITGGKGDIVNGPLLWYYNDGSDNDIELELVGGQPVGVDYSVAYVAGYDSSFTLTSDASADLLPDDSVIRLGQVYFENWRDSSQPSGPEDGFAQPMSGSRFANDTNRRVVIGQSATGNVGYSLAPVISNGKENYYDGVTLVPSGSRLEVSHTKGLGNSGSEVGADFSGNNIVYTGTPTSTTPDDNGTVVEIGATLELLPGIAIVDEKLTVTGHGVDGQGALYSEGQTGSGTRFGSSSRGDEGTIFLDGNASIGVGVAGNQLLIGSLQGTGNFTKRGPGKLSIEKASTLVGTFTVAEGEVVARSNVVTGGLTVNQGASIGAISNNAVNTTSTVFLYGELDVNARSDDSNLTAAVGPLFGPGVVTASNQAASQASTLTIETATGLGYFVGQIQDQINLVKSGADSQVLTGANTYTGTTSVSEGLLQVDGTHTGGGDYTVNDGGTLGGTGNIDSTAIVQSGGVLAPGASAGELTIDTVELLSGSVLEIELGGTSSHDLLTTDTITLGGDLSIRLLEAGGELFMPAANDTFTIVLSDSLTGTFGNGVNGARIDTVGGEGSFKVIYGSSFDQVILADFLPDSLAGDYNNDGLVDASDYTVWRDADGQAGVSPFSGADGNGDGQITAADYEVWSNNFGAFKPANTIAVVPEPSSLILLIGVSVFIPWHPKRAQCI